jgi:hypothetical protein
MIGVEVRRTAMAVCPRCDGANPECERCYGRGTLPETTEALAARKAKAAAHRGKAEATQKAAPGQGKSSRLTASDADRQYVLKFNGKLRSFRTRKDAVTAAKKQGRGAEVWMRVLHYRTLDYATQTLTRPDQARGPRNVLRGQATKFLTHRVVDHVEEIRIY